MTTYHIIWADDILDATTAVPAEAIVAQYPNIPSLAGRIPFLTDASVADIDFGWLGYDIDDIEFGAWAPVEIDDSDIDDISIDFDELAEVGFHPVFGIGLVLLAVASIWATIYVASR